MTRLVLLDRDGVLNEDREDYVKTPEELVLIPRSAAAVARLANAGFRVAVVTNQSAVGRGIITEAELDAIHAALEAALANDGAALDAIYVAPDAPDAATERRKPGPGMLLEALRDFGAEPGETAMVGDTLRDMEAAKAAGCARILVRSGKGRATLAAGLPHSVKPVEVVDDLWQAADLLISKHGG
jgi:D-glycero-D-manno-heptose 1,7-bisphosphate phosphatase